MSEQATPPRASSSSASGSGSGKKPKGSDGGSRKKVTPMIWTDEHNELLMREVLLVEPYQFKVSTKERGNAWNGIVEDLNNIRSRRFHVNKRSVREHYGLLLTNYKRKMAEINKASGINVIETPLDSIIREILERAKEYEEMFEKENEEKSEKLEAERLNAEEMRLKAMENLRETKKRSKEKTGDETETIPKTGRVSGAEGIAF